MVWTAISNTVPQYSKNAGGAAASGYYLKAYADGTTTPIMMATDASGNGQIAKSQLDSLGYPLNGSSDIFIPYVNENYKLALYENATDADNNTLGSAVWVVDNIEKASTEDATTSAISTAVAAVTVEGTVKTFGTLNDAVIDTGLADGDTVDIKERTANNGGGAMWDVVLASTVTPNAYTVVQCTGVGTLALVLRTEEGINIAAAGCLSGGMDNSSALDVIFATEQLIIIPEGDYYSSGSHTINAGQSIYGQGLNRSILRGTSTTGTFLNFPASDETAVVYGGNSLENFSVFGADKANATTGIKIKNKTDVSLDHIGIEGFGVGLEGPNDASTNSCTSISIVACRIRANGIGAYLKSNWNTLRIYGGVVSGDTWSLVIYNSRDIDINCNFQSGTSAVGNVFLGGCTSFSVNGYCEGSASSGAFVHLTSSKDKDGNATNNGISIGATNSGQVGVNCSSAAGVPYNCLVDGATKIIFTKNDAGSGMGTAVARLVTGTTGCVAFGNDANPGSVFSYQDNADRDNNFEYNFSNRIESVRASKVTVGGGPPSDLSGDLVSTSGGDVAHIFYDGNRNIDQAALEINNYGYQGAQTKFRRFFVRDGKGNLMIAVYPDTGVSGRTDILTPLRLTSLPTSSAGLSAGDLWNDSGTVKIVV